MLNLFDAFRPERNATKDCLVLNPEGGTLATILMTEDEAESFARKVVAGRMPSFNGTIECFVVRVTPVSRFRDKEISNVSVERVPAVVPENALNRAASVNVEELI